MGRLAFLLVALVGCAPQQSGDESHPTCTDVFFADTDGDGHGDAGAAETACSAPSGYVATGDDCDDSDGSIHPGANEVCDGLDDDCDARIDVDAIDEETWYADADLDGFGDEATTTTACAHPEGYISVAGDCADDDAEVNPDADELCNDIDDDCDELVDSLDPSLVQGTVWYADADADGYGDPATGAHACEPQVGKIADGTDCDDADPAVHPSVDEMCNDQDDDCDGLVDGDDDGLVDGLPFYADADGDGLGDGDAVVSDCSVPSGYIDNAEDCDDGDATVGASPDYYADDDGDGYGDGAPVHTCTPTASLVTVDGDCRDSDADINPSATETCDSRDNNCDGLVDDDDPLVVSTTWYADDDGDGYGDPLDTLAACQASAGYVHSSTDCDDADAELHPGATEYCDGIDNDCDGTTDDAVVYSDWYPDDDGDGYGVTDDAKTDCVAPSGYTAVGGDCDDASSATHPGATELCANEVDDDCDTDVDDCQISSALADFMAVGGAWSWFAYDLDVADADADGVSDLLVGSFVDLALYVVYGPASGSTTTASLVALRAADTTITAFGSAIGAGDANDDGVDDVLAGSDHIDGDGTSYLFLGPITADRDTTDADAVLAGPLDSLAGCRLDVVGDFDGDGASDVVIGAPGDTGVLATAYVVTGPTSGAIDLTADAAYLYEGASATDDLAVVQRVGDMNADGIDDLAVDDWSGPGTVYLIDGGSAPGTYAVDVAASASLKGPESGSQLGYSMQSVDYDADGALDLVVGAWRADSPRGFEAGAVFAFLGPLSGSLDGRDAAVVWVADATVEGLGRDIAVGDVDGAEGSDLLLGASWAAGNDGEAFLQLGPASGVVEVNGLVSFRGASGDQLGQFVAIVPDWTGDDRDEVALAALYHSDAAGDLIGAVYAFDSESIFGP